MSNPGSGQVSLQNSGNGEIKTRKQEVHLTTPLPTIPNFGNDALMMIDETVTDKSSSRSKCSESIQSMTSTTDDAYPDFPNQINPPVLN